MNLRPFVAGSAIVLASCLTVGAVSTSAFASGGMPVSTTAAGQQAGTISDVRQEQVAHDATQYVKVTATVSTRTSVRLLPVGDDGSGQAKDATPDRPVVFFVKPTGADTARYTLDTGDGTAVTPVVLDFRGMPLSAPEDLSSAHDLESISRQVARGNTTNQMRFEALPGADVTVSVNGRSTEVRADRSGTATATLDFVDGDNEVRAQQSLGSKRSEVSVEHYRFGKSGEQPGGEQPGGGQQVNPDSLRISTEYGARLELHDGKVTVEGTAEGGYVTALSGRKPLGGSAVEGNRWSVDLPLTVGTHLVNFTLSASEGSAPVRAQGLVVRVVEPTGGEQIDPASFGIGVQDFDTVTLRDGKGTLSGTASGGVVVIEAIHGKTVVAPVVDGRWSAEVPLTEGIATVRFALAASAQSPAVAEQRRVVRVQDGETADAIASFHIDGLDDAHPVQGGQITVTGTAKSGKVVVRDLNRQALGEATVRDGRWSIRFYPGVQQGAAALNFEYSATASGPVLKTERHDVRVTTPGTDPSKPFAVDQSHQVVSEHGVVTFTGTAPGSSVAVSERGRQLGRAEVVDGRWSLSVPLDAKWHALRFSSLGGAYTNDQNVVVKVVEGK